MAGTGRDDGDKREGEASSTIKRKKIRGKPSLVSLAMARTASEPADVCSIESKELIQGLYKGVLLDNNKVKFWIDEKLHAHGFMVLARKLDITWGGSPEYWTWESYQEDCFGGAVHVDEARLIKVCWLEVWGSFPSIMLSPMVTYEVVFKLKLTENAGGWHTPVDFGLTLPNGKTQSRAENFQTKPKGQWFEITSGEFVADKEINGNIRFSLGQYAGDWKMGMVVRGVIFRPKY